MGQLGLATRGKKASSLFLSCQELTEERSQARTGLRAQGTFWGPKQEGWPARILDERT